MKKAFFIMGACILIASSAWSRPGEGRQRDNSDLVDRLVQCWDEKNQIERDLQAEIYRLQQEVAYLESQLDRQVTWSCTAGCVGSGNVGFGSGKSEAEAKAAALRDLGLTCSHHTFDCSKD